MCSQADMQMPKVVKIKPSSVQHRNDIVDLGSCSMEIVLYALQLLAYWQRQRQNITD